MSIQIPRGTQDILPGEVEKWQFIEAKAREICDKYQYQEIRTPMFEHTELFNVELAIQLILSKKKCIHLKTVGEAA